MCNVCNGSGIVYTQLSYGVRADGCIACPREVQEQRERERIKNYQTLKAKFQRHVNRRRAV